MGRGLCGEIGEAERDRFLDLPGEVEVVAGDLGRER